MKEVLRGHQRSSEAIRGTHTCLRSQFLMRDVIRGHQRPFEVIRGHPRQSEAIRGNQ